MPATRLESVPIGNCMDAPAALGVRRSGGGYVRVPVVFQPSRSGCGCCITIPKGFQGLVTRHGSYVGQWGAGIYLAPPWVTVSHLVPEQYVVYDTPVKECPTKDNVMVTIDVTIILRIMTDDPKLLMDFCYTLGPRGLDDMLKAFQEESIRGMARKRKYNEIYDLMDTQQDAVMEQTREELNNHFKQYGVEIASVAVTNVHLPHEFANTMQEATVWQNRNEFKTLQQKYELRKIEAREAEAKDKQRCKEDLDKFMADKDTEVAALNKKRQLVLAETSKQLAQIKEQEKFDVLQINSTARLEVSEINAKRDVTLAKIRADGVAESEKIRIETDTYVKIKKADAENQVSNNTAKALDLTAAAEAYAARALEARRTYEEKMRQLQTMRALANNPQLAVAGDSKDNVMAQVLANQVGGAVLGVNAQ